MFANIIKTGPDCCIWIDVKTFTYLKVANNLFIYSKIRKSLKSVYIILNLRQPDSNF